MKRPDTLANEIEKLLGRTSSEALIGASGLDDDPLLLNWVRRIGGEVAVHSGRQDARPEFIVLGSDVANALTLPGSKVLVTRGLLDEVTSDDELAGVLAHEVGHVTRRHAWKQLENNAIFAILMAVLRPRSAALRQTLPILNVLRALAQSRENEYEADAQGLRFASAAGYAPTGLLRFIETMASGPLAKWEEYFSTHPPGALRTERGRAEAVVHASDDDSRAAVAAGFDQRGLAGLAQLVRLGRDPLTHPPVSVPVLSARTRQERGELLEKVRMQQKHLVGTYKPLVTGSTLQQLLLLTAQSQDLRFIALSTHAYLVQFRLQDIYARTIRTLRTALPVWDDLLPVAGAESADERLGRTEVNDALMHLEAVPVPLQCASQATLTVLTDLHLGRFYRLSSGAQWTRIAAVEGMLRYAESELSRADHASGVAWRYLALARIRRYQRRLDAIVTEASPRTIALWQTLAQKRLGRTVEWSGSAGSASVAAALSVQRGRTLPAPPGTLWANWVVQSEGIPENIATTLRLLTLDLERERAAGASLGWKD